MPLTISASGMTQAADTVGALNDALQQASIAAARAAATQARQAAIDATAKVYTLTPEVIGKYVSVDAPVGNNAAATVRIMVRALPLEAFAPQVRMQRFTFTDRAGRHVSRVLPAVYFTRLQGSAPTYLRPAFPLHQRTTGTLSGGDRIVKRTGRARDKLTSFRFYTFPKKFLSEQLIPAVELSLAEGFKAEFKFAERLANGRLRNS